MYRYIKSSSSITPPPIKLPNFVYDLTFNVSKDLDYALQDCIDKYFEVINRYAPNAYQVNPFIVWNFRVYGEYKDSNIIKSYNSSVFENSKLSLSMTAFVRDTNKTSPHFSVLMQEFLYTDGQADYMYENKVVDNVNDLLRYTEDDFSYYMEKTIKDFKDIGTDTI